MKFYKGIVFVIVFLCMTTFLVAKVYAEAGLSEMGRTEDFILNDKYAVSILTDSDLGGDSIDVYEYQKDPEVNIFNSWYKSQYIAKGCYVDGISKCGNFVSPVYIQGDYIWDKDSYFNYKTGESSESSDYEISNDLFGPSSSDKLQKAGVSIEKSEVFNHEYIVAHYSRLDIDNTGGFGDFIGVILTVLFFVAAVFAIFITAAIILTVKHFKKIRNNEILHKV
jgi:hypothetical protein